MSQGDSNKIQRRKKIISSLSRQSLWRRKKLEKGRMQDKFATPFLFTGIQPTDMAPNTPKESSKPSLELKVQNKLNNFTAHKPYQLGVKQKEGLSLKQKLTNWIVCNNVNRVVANQILEILRSEGLTVPKDSRTLLKTKKEGDIINNDEDSNYNSGSYYHFGLVQGLNYVLKFYESTEVPETLNLFVNIDGLPLTKSSCSQFWPILVHVANIRSDPFLVGVFHGSKKPENLHKFLNPFVQDLQKHSFIFKGKCIYFKLTALICDAPAKSFVLGVKSHNAYFGCTKCTTQGTYFDGRVIYPELKAPLRTNNSFRQKYDEEYHVRDTTLSKLDIDLVRDVPLDYMHLICLGVTKKLILLWVKGNKRDRIADHDIKKINLKLKDCRKYVPSDFARLPRPLNEIDRFKATELRQFLLYTGMVVLKGILPVRKFQHFMLLSIAIRIICSPKNHLKYLHLARKYLDNFISEFKIIYGLKHCSYNLHNLSHLCDDVLKYGPLDNFSAFLFENELQKIKKLIRVARRPLSQLVHRVNEIRTYKIEPKINVYPATKHPFIKNAEESFQAVSISPQLYLSIYDKNNICGMDNGDILLITEIKNRGQQLMVGGYTFCETVQMFNFPLPSEDINIFGVKNKLADIIQYYELTQIKRKYVKYELSDTLFLIQELLH